MTIAIGILAKDGVVIAADSQLTIQNIWKGSHGKIMALERVKMPGGFLGACVVTGATSDFPYLVSLGQEILGAFELQSHSDPEQSLEAPLRKVVRRFETHHVVPYRDVVDIAVETIVATSRPFGDELWSTKRSTLSSHSGYVAVGIGAAHADALLQRLWRRPQYDVAAAAALAVFVALSVKESVDGCGKVTNVVMLQDSAFHQMPQSLVGRLEEQFSEYFQAHEPQLVRLMLGVESGPPDGQPDAAELVSGSLSSMGAAVVGIIGEIRDETPRAHIRAAHRRRAEAAAAKSGREMPAGGSSGEPPSQE